VSMAGDGKSMRLCVEDIGVQTEHIIIGEEQKEVLERLCHYKGLHMVIPVGPRAPVPSSPLSSSHLAQATEAATAHLAPPHDRLEDGPPPLAVHGVVRGSPEL
jgi:hypothetical protein